MVSWDRLYYVLYCMEDIVQRALTTQFFKQLIYLVGMVLLLYFHPCFFLDSLHCCEIRCETPLFSQVLQLCLQFLECQHTFTKDSLTPTVICSKYKWDSSMKCLFIGQRRLIQTFFFLKSSLFALYSFPCFSLSHFLLLLSVMNIFHLPLCFYCDHVPSSHLVPLAMVSFCHWSNRKYHHALWILDYQLDQQSILLKSA